MQSGTAIFEQFKAQFTRSLRDLCGKKGSINVVCRDLKINRQQFAKYLSGTNLPSAYVIQRLVLYFSVDPAFFFIENKQRQRFASKTPALLSESGPSLNEGFYLEYTLAARSDSLSTGLWRFEKSENRMFCHGEIPRLREGRKHAFDSFNGQVVKWGRHHQLMAVTQCGTNTISLSLSPFDMSVSDLLAVRITSIGNQDTVQCTSSILRYVGTEVDIAQLLMSQCGIVKISRLDERTASIVKLLSERVSSHGSGFRLAT